MCRIKQYSDRMQSHLTSVLLRLDTYLLADDFEKCTMELKDLSKGIPSDIRFDDINVQLIDIDSVAELHQVYINNVLKSDLIRLSKARFNDVVCDIYVNPYFVAFDIPSAGRKIEELVGDVKSTILEKINISLFYGYLRLNYSVCEKSEADLWKICDRSAFPVLDGSAYNGKYTDSMERDGMFVDLSRTISPSDDRGELLDVNIQTKAFLPVVDTKDVAEKIMNVVELSKCEISRCFKN